MAKMNHAKVSMSDRLRRERDAEQAKKAHKRALLKAERKKKGS